jgi:hypothetical protein
MLQNGFNQIRDVDREETNKNVKFKWALKIYKLYKLDRLRSHFNKWRDCEYNSEMREIRQCRKDT